MRDATGAPDREILAELRSGEKLLWSGRPPRGLRLVRGDLFAVPFSLLWGGFAVFWELGVLRGDAPLFMALWGIPFVLIGLHLILGRFFWDAYRRGRTSYGLTDRRIVIVSRTLGRTVTSLELANLPSIEMSARDDRSGTLALGPSAGMPSRLEGTSWPGVQSKLAPRLEGIPRVREVHDQILRAKEELTRAALPTGRA